MGDRTSSSGKSGACNNSRGAIVLLVSMRVMMAIVVAIVVIGGIVGIMVMYMEAPLERKPDKLGLALEPERSVDDELPDIVETSVHRQYTTRVRVLRNRSGENVHREFRRKVREGRHGEFRVPRPESRYRLKQGEQRVRLNLTPLVSIRF